jgi:hypothetical protein
VAALATGVILWVTAPREHAQVSFVPSIADRSVAITAVGRF